MALFQRISTPVAEIAPEGEAPDPAGLRSAGDVLRQQREALGLALGDVAAALRIKPAYLTAIEEGRPERLPGRAYAIGFMRAYADHLGLDSTEILRRAHREVARLAAKPDLSFPMPLGDSSVPGGATVLLGLVLAICAYGTWYYLSAGERSRPERVSEVPADLLAAKPRPPAPAPRRTPPSDRGSTDQKPAGATTAASGSSLAAGATPIFAVPSGPAPAIPGSPGPRTPPQAGPNPAPAALPEIPRAFGAIGAPSRVVLQATADSWIEVRDADRKVLFSGVLKPGETYLVPDRPGVSLRAGNAGGLKVLVDGKPAPALGPTGAIRRNVALDPQSLTAPGTVR